MWRNRPEWRVFVILIFCLLAGCGTTSPDMQTMLQNLSSNYPNLWRLITATSYVMGFAFAFMAIYKLKAYGEARTMMSSSHSIKGPIVYLIVAAALIYAPTMYHTLLMTTFGDPNTTPLSVQSLEPVLSAQATEALLGLVQVVGLVAFIRGWVYIARLAEHSGQPGNFGKGLTHIIGGLFAINIVGTKQLIWNTFGFG